MHSLEDIASDSALHVGIPTISVRIRTAPTWLVLRTQVVELMQQTTKSAHYYSNAMGRHDELTRSVVHAHSITMRCPKEVLELCIQPYPREFGDVTETWIKVYSDEPSSRMSE